MSDRTLLICPGATKAGTSWLYRWLHDHSACHLRAVKELHYFSSFDSAELAKKTAVFESQVARYQAERDAAVASNTDWKIRNMTRRIGDTGDLIAALNGDRTGDAGYARYLTQSAPDGAIVGDISPAYAILDDATLARMASLPFRVKVLYLVRDPLERLWSHVRMHAKRFLRDGQEVVSKSGFVLGRILNKGHESHITERGDYAGTIERYARVFGDDLKVAFAENLSTDAGQKDICAFLGIHHEAPEQRDRSHVGLSIPFPEQRRRATVKMLADQYDYIAERFGPLPANWVANRAVLA